MEYSKRLKEISELGNDWNGYGSKKIQKEILEKANVFEQKIKHLEYEIFPIAADWLQFDIGGDIEIEITKEGYNFFVETNKEKDIVDILELLNKKDKKC